MFQLSVSKLLFLLNCTLFSHEHNHHNQFKSISRKEHKAEKIIQKPLSLPHLFTNISTHNHKAVGNKFLYKTSSMKASAPLHRKGLLTLLNKNRFKRLFSKCQIVKLV